MSVETLNPKGIFAPSTYVQVGIGKGSRIVCLSGQVAHDIEGNVVGKGDLAAQAAQAFLNVGRAVQAVGGSFADVVKLTVYVPGWTPEKMNPLVEGAMRTAAESGFDGRRPITLIGVAALATPELLIEVEALAVLD